MIKKAVFENDLIAGMQKELAANDKSQAMGELVKAADCLHAAMEIFEDAGLTSSADRILSILEKIACDEHDARGKPNKPKNPTNISDSHTKGLTPEKMISNLKNHGTQFNMADDGKADDLLNLDIEDYNNPLEIEDASYQKDFEDES